MSIFTIGFLLIGLSSFGMLVLFIYLIRSINYLQDRIDMLERHYHPLDVSPEGD